MAAAQPPLKLNVNGLGAPRAATPVALWPTLARDPQIQILFDTSPDSGMWVSQECSREDTDNSQIHNVRRRLHNSSFEASFHSRANNSRVVLLVKSIHKGQSLRAL